MISKLWVVLKIIPEIVQGQQYNRFYEPTKDYAKKSSIDSMTLHKIMQNNHQ
jgi:hypothetical protein